MIKLVEDHNRAHVTVPNGVCRPSDSVYNFVLASNVEQSVAIPSGTNYIRIKRGGLKKDYNANVYLGFGSTPISIPSVSGFMSPVAYDLPSDMATIDIRGLNGTLRIISDEDVKVQVCFFS